MQNDNILEFIPKEKQTEELWSLVVLKAHPNSIAIFGETPEARQRRYDGKGHPEVLRFLREFDQKENGFINKMRQNETDYSAFQKILIIMHHETASWTTISKPLDESMTKMVRSTQSTVL